MTGATMTLTGAAEEHVALGAGGALLGARVGEDERAALAHRAGEERVALGDALVEEGVGAGAGVAGDDVLAPVDVVEVHERRA